VGDAAGYVLRRLRARLSVSQGDMCSTFHIHGFPTMKLGTAADMAALAVDKLVAVEAASRHASSVIAWLAKQLDV
jgi:hypothetical protein